MTRSAVDLSASPATVVADGATTSTITVTLKDAQSNLVAGKTVTLAKGGGSSTITTVSGVTNGSGVATFTVKDKVAETTTYTATDTADAITVGQTAAVSFTAGAVNARAVDVSAAPASVTADGVDDGDGDGDRCATSSGTRCRPGRHARPRAAAPRQSPRAPGRRTPRGVAAFTVVSTTAETVTYTATIGTTGVLQTAQVVFTPGPATQLVFGQQPTATVSGAAIAPAITVRVLDSQGNLTASTAAITLAIKSGTGAPGSTLPAPRPGTPSPVSPRSPASRSPRPRPATS